MPFRPLIIAHRGFSSRNLENSITSIRAALELGVDMVEIDVHETADHQLVVFHDYRLNRICRVPQRVCDTTLSEIQQLNPDIPTLTQALRLCRNRARVLLEIKRASPSLVANEIRKSKMTSQVIVFSFSASRMAAFAAAAPDVSRYGLIARRLNDSLARLNSAVQVDGLGIDRRLIHSPVVITRLHRLGLRVFVWTVNNRQYMKRLADWGVDGIITNYPDMALQVLRAREP
jgi:glycerophosphoryl diester phosphodiesterase